MRLLRLDVDQMLRIRLPFPKTVERRLIILTVVAIVSIPPILTQSLLMRRHYAFVVPTTPNVFRHLNPNFALTRRPVI